MDNKISKQRDKIIEDQPDQIAQRDEIIEDFLKEYQYEQQQVLVKGDFSMVIKLFLEKSECLVTIKVFKKIKGQSQIELEELEKERYQDFRKTEEQDICLTNC